MQYDVHQAKTHLSRLLERAPQGEEIVIGKDGLPYARLMPLETSQTRELGFLRGTFSVGDDILDPLEDEDLRTWE